MKTPTLEEVKEYFKDAKTIRTNTGIEKIKIDLDRISVDYGQCYTKVDDYFYTIWDCVNGYAKIISHK